ncbi:hypothetical protein PENTCL1PPCAC_12233, partial [Pristionchus entomophagus]
HTQKRLEDGNGGGRPRLIYPSLACAKLHTSLNHECIIQCFSPAVERSPTLRSSMILLTRTSPIWRSESRIRRRCPTTI